MKLRSGEVCSQNAVTALCQRQDSFKEIARRLKMGKLVAVLHVSCARCWSEHFMSLCHL